MVVCAPSTPDAHCCVIEGEVCPALTFDLGQGLYRCSIWNEMGEERWQALPVGRWFARTHPGYTCHDWPQNIPEVMERGIGLCCWQEATDGN